MDVLGGGKTLYISTAYIVDNQTVKIMYKQCGKACFTQKKLYLCNYILIIKSKQRCKKSKRKNLRYCLPRR